MSESINVYVRPTSAAPHGRVKKKEHPIDTNNHYIFLSGRQKVFGESLCTHKTVIITSIANRLHTVRHICEPYRQKCNIA